MLIPFLLRQDFQKIAMQMRLRANTPPSYSPNTYHVRWCPDTTKGRHLFLVDMQNVPLALVQLTYSSG